MKSTIAELAAWAREHVSWFGQSAFRIVSQSGMVIVIDPYRMPPSAGPADLILITHPHSDHFDRRAVAALSRDGTVTVGPASMAEEGLQCLAIGEARTFGGVEVQAVAAYNLAKAFHAREKGWVGYLIAVDGRRLYHAGDTDNIPEMKGLRPDVAMLPIGGMFTMGRAMAAEAVAAIEPKLVVPMHFGMLIGGRRAGERFAASLGERGLLLPRA